MDSAWKNLRNLLAHLRRSAHHALNLVLLLFLAGQTLLAFYFARRDSLEPPAFLVERLRSELALRGLRLDWDRAVFDLQGNVRVDRPRAGPAFKNDVWATAEVATARLDRISLLLGKVRWREIAVENLSVIAPGEPVPVVSGLSLQLGRTLGEITVGHAYGRVLGIEVAATGPLGDPSRWFVTETSVAAVPGPTPSDLSKDSAAFLSSAAGLARTLEPWRESRVRLVLAASETGPPRVRLAVSGPGDFTVPLPGLDSPASFGGWQLDAGEWGLAEWKARLTPALRLRLDRFAVPGVVALSKLRVETAPAVFPAGPDGWRAWLHNAKPLLSAGSVTALDHTVGPVALATSGLDRWPALEGRLWTRWEGRPVSLSGRVNPVEGSADVVVQSDASCAEIFARLPGPVSAELEKRLSWEGSTHLSPRLVFDPGWKFARAELRATVHNFRLKPSTLWDELTFDAVATPDGIEVARASTLCREAGYAATASYSQRWSDTAFLLQVEGRVRPKDLNPVLDEEWWHRLWRDLTDFPELPFAMVTVGGHWNRPKEIGARVVSTLPAGGKYQGVQAESGYVLVAHSRVRTELSDLKVGRAGGKEWLRGSLGWTDPTHLPEPREGPVTMDVNLRLRADLAEVAPLFGPDFGEVTKTLRLSAPPILAITGWSHDSSGAADFDWRIHAVTEGPSGWKQFDFEALELDIHVRPRLLDLTGVKGRFLDGDLAGNVFLKNPGDLLDLDLTLANASWPRLLDWAKSNQHALGPAPAAPALETAPAVPAETKGRVWLTLKAVGPAADPVSFAGRGTLRVEEAELQTVRIFGGLSRLLETLGASFATFELNRLESVFSLADKTVALESLKVEGPRARMSANGSARLTDRALDIDADLDLGKPAEEKNIIGRIISLPFDTITKLLPIKLFGTLDQPDWRFKADPRSLIFGQPGMKPEVPAPVPPTPAPETPEAK